MQSEEGSVPADDDPAECVDDDYVPPPTMGSLHLEAISEHIARHIGPIYSVFHEITSEIVHVDVHYVRPTTGRDYITLVTSGMSDLPMNVPAECVDFRYAELLINLPPDWPISKEAFEDENNFWPVRCLEWLARYPHREKTWLGWGHTWATGDPPAPLAPDVPFTSFLIELPLSAGPEFYRLEVAPAKTINFYALVPLYTEEMNVKLRKGTEHLEKLFDRHGIDDIVDVGRRNVAKSGLSRLFWRPPRR